MALYQKSELSAGHTCHMISGFKLASPCTSLWVRPYTCTRAELVAISCSLQHAPEEACAAATDSNASMHIPETRCSRSKTYYPRSALWILLAAMAAQQLEHAQAGIS